MWLPCALPAAVLVLFASPLTTTATELLEGYGRDPFELPCGHACRYAVPTMLECPEFVGMTAEEIALVSPSAACMANDTAYLTSMAWCIKQRCDEGEPYKIATFWNTVMIDGLDESGFVLRYSYDEALARVDRNPPPEPLAPTEFVLNRTAAVLEPVYISFLNTVKSYQASGKNESKYSLLVFLSGIIIPISFSFLRFIPISARFRSKLYAYVIDPPAFGKRHSVPILGLGIVPTRGQALFILYIIAINAVATFEGYPEFAPNGLYPDRRYELKRLIGNRAGVIAFANVPLIVLYAGRNSLLLRLTNWSHSTFLLLHRWIATICILQVILHSLIWLRLMVEADSHAIAVTYPYWYWGIAGTLGFALFLPFSLLAVRRILYEVFLIAHICLAVLILVSSWYHIWYLYEDSSGFEVWLLIAIAVWGYERFLRVLRVSKNGVKRAYITRVEGDKYLRVDIPDVSAHGHCFVYFPTLTWRVWENHPFSVVNCSAGQLQGNTGDSQSSSRSQSDTESPVLASTAIDLASKETGNVTSNAQTVATRRNISSRPGITLFIRPQSGLTKLLAQKAGNEAGVPILIESSYGNSDNNHFAPSPEYPNLLVIAGGVGITGVLPALNSSRSMFARPLGTTKLYWGIKSRGLVDAVKGMIVGEDAKEEKSAGSEDTAWGHIEAHTSVGERIDIRKVLTDELERATGGTTVVVCGPLPMCDEARYTCAALARHGANIKYVEESFSW